MAGTAKITEKPIINPALADYLFLMQNGSVVRATVNSLSDLLNSDTVGRGVTSIGTAAPTASTAGEVGSLYYDSVNEALYLCVGSDSMGTSWAELQGTASGGGAGNLSGTVDPDSSTAGLEGQLYVNTTSGKLFVCTSDNGDGTYTWAEVSGSGGSGTTSESVIKITNGMGSKTITVVAGNSAVISYSWSSVDSSDGSSTGNGTASWYVNNTRVAVQSVGQGANTFNVTDYLTSGATNIVKLTIEDLYGTQKSFIWSVTVAAYSLSWAINDDIAVYGGNNLELVLTPSGSGTKTVHVTVDGVEVLTQETQLSGRAFSYTLTTAAIQTAAGFLHGAHAIEAWLTATINSDTISTTHLRHVGIWTETGETSPIVAILNPNISTTQYTTVSLRWMVYDPQNETATATKYVGGVASSVETVGRTVQTWAYKATSTGAVTLKIQCGAIYAEATVTASGSGYDIRPVTSGLQMDLDPTGHTNTEAGYNEFGYTDGSGSYHSLTYSSNFDWVNGGFQQDENGITALVIRRGTYVEFDRSLFPDDISATGKEIKIIFRSANVRDYDAEMLNGKTGNIGLMLTAQTATLSSNLASIDLPYCEDKMIEMDLNILPIQTFPSGVTAGYATAWLEGKPSRVMTFTRADSWRQTAPNVLRIGSDQCDVWLYRLKLYGNYLDDYSILDNFIADCPDAEEMIARYERNDIFDDSGTTIDPGKLSTQNPNLRVITITINGDHMTASKSDNVSVDISHRLSNGGTGDNWTATGAIMKAQGTSSLQYGYSALNLDIDLSGATEWIDAEDTAMTGYGMTANSIPVNYFNLKLNVASSENANNVCLADEYNTFNPCKAPGYASDHRIRDTVEGHPCAIFIRNNSSSGDAITVGARNVAFGETIFYGSGDMNNSKKNYAVFGEDNSTYPQQCVVEITNNNNNPCLFKSDDLSTETWDSDGNFEFRYPKKPSDANKAAWQSVLSWVVSTDTTNPSGERLESPVTYGSRTFVSDSAEYRAAKFVAEVAYYFDVDSLLFHYLFTERHLMVDNRAKNTFPAYEPDGNGNYRWNWRHDYDNDTADGNDNSGGLTFTYGMEDTDRVGDSNVFNAADSVLWCNVRDLMQTELAAMYRTKESEGAWSATRFLSKVKAYQAARPEAMVMQDMRNKYILPYVNLGNTSYLGMLYGDKTDQREQFERYQEAYIASKYSGTLATSNAIELRLNGNDGDMAITPYSDLYVAVHYGNSGTVKVRTKRGQTAIIDCPADSLSDLETSIYSANWLSDLGDLSTLYTKRIELTAEKLLNLQLGSGETGYQNTGMTAAAGGIAFGNVPLIETVDLRGIVNLNSALDLSNLSSLKTFRASGSGITGVTFADGGPLETIDLPAVTLLRAQNLQNVTSFQMTSGKLQDVWVEGCSSAVDTQAMIEGSSSIIKARLIGVSWNVTAVDAVLRLIGIEGYDATGTTVNKAVVTGTLHAEKITQDEIDALAAEFPSLTVTYDTLLTPYTVTFQNYDGTVLNTQTIRSGAAATDPVRAGLISTPTRASTVDTVYTYSGWDVDFSEITHDLTVTATYATSTRIYTVKWYREEGGTVLYTANTVAYGTVKFAGTEPTPATGDIFAGWDKLTTNVTSNLDVYAVFASPTMPVAVPSGQDYLYSDDPSDSMAYSASEFYGLLYNAAAGEISLDGWMSIGDKIKICCTSDVFADTEIVLQLESFKHYKNEDGTGWAGPYFGMVGVMNAGHRMNDSNTNVGGWDSSEMRTWLNETIFPELPAFWRNLISPVQVLASAGNTSATILTSVDRLFLRSQAEMGLTATEVPYVNEIASGADETTFSLYTDNDSRIKKPYNGSGSAQNYHLRSANAVKTTDFRYTNYVGGGNYSSGGGAVMEYGVSFGFCLL